MYISGSSNLFSRPRIKYSQCEASSPKFGGEAFKGTFYKKTRVRKKYQKIEWDKLNFIQRTGYGIAYLSLGLAMSTMALIMPKRELGHTLAFNRMANASQELENELENYKKGIKTKPKSAKEEKEDAWDTFKRINMSILFSYFGSKRLAVATVHLDPQYKEQKEEKSNVKLASQEFMRQEPEKMGLIGRLGHKLMSWNFKFSEKYDLADDCDYYIPSPPPKLNFIDNFFLKHYFKTNPSWEYTEEERQKISQSYRS